MASSADKLKHSVSRLCWDSANAPVELNRKVTTQFKALYLGWAEVQHIKFGPVSFLKRLERLQYWPDKHNSSERQIRKLLLNIDADPQKSLANFSKKSVAVQGLTALERMLFSKDKLMDDAECKLAVAVTTNLASITMALDSSWRLAPVEYAKEFELADRGTGTYNSNEEVTTILANGLATQLLIISEYKLGRALPKKEGGRTFARQMEAWRSELSLDLARASVKSLRSLYRVAFKSRLKTKNKALHKRIEKQFSVVLSLFKKAKEPMVDLIETDEGIVQIRDLKMQVEKLESLVRNELFTELGFAVRFNSLDGD